MELQILDELLNSPTIILAVVALLMAGKLLKAFPKLPSEYIPTILAVSGAIILFVIDGYSMRGALLGFIIGSSATGVHQMPTQIINKRKSNGNTEIISKDSVQ